MPSNYKAITEYNEEQLGKDTASRKTQVSMYSDPTHFVYELLQNADDYGATEVLFKLSEDEVVIEHNAESFKEKHVRAITYFGKSTSREDLVKTGRFGIGFKSVFAFTATPIIISDPEHFQIYGLYRVKEYPYPDGFSRSSTRIVLPFNHDSEQPDFVEELMSKKEAYRQISECLVGLDMNVLLFTRNIREIRWEIADQSECYSREDEIDDNGRLTTIKDRKNENTYLVFSKIPMWESEEHKPVEIAFAVDALHQLAPIHNEFLHVLFPTIHRTDLRFILNGPYRTNPARETISLTDAFNIHLMKVTCDLMKELLPKLRERKLLTIQSLSIFPNEEDMLSSFYVRLRNIVVNEFQNTKLTPTKRGDHAAASGLYRVNAELSDLISDEDLAVLLGKDCSMPFIVDEISQQRDARGRFVRDPNAQFIDNFLNTLGIPDWNMRHLINALIARPKMIGGWLRKQTIEWHQRFYASLYDFLRLRWTGTYWYSPDSNLKNKLSDLSIVPCSNSIYRAGGKCFFPSDDVEHDERFPRVLKGVYSSGQNDDQKLKARDLLKAIGVRLVDEAVEIEAILNLRYVNGTIELSKPHHKRDLERFIAFLEGKPEKSDLFNRYYIFESDNESWGQPRMFFLDLPYQKTDLMGYYGIFDKDSNNRKMALSLKYEGLSIDIEKFKKFAIAVGVETKPDIIEQEIPNDHPEYNHLITSAPGERVTYTSRNEDYIIDKFDIFSYMPADHKKNGDIDKALDAAKLIWQTMCSQPHNCLEARFRKNSSYPDRVGASSLVHAVKKGLWVPQKDGDSISFVSPCDASREHLPEKDGFPWPKGYPHDAGETWLKAVEFGKTAKEQKEEYTQRDQQAKEDGFASLEEKENCVEFARRLREEGKSIDDVISQYHSQNSKPEVNFPISLVKNPERRKERVLEQLENAPEKVYEEREHRERESKREIAPRTPLINWYTNESGEMICQICKKEMPFKKVNDEYYFVAVEALTIRFKNDELPKNHFPKEYEAQYLALCPECSARYNYFVREVREGMEIMEELRTQVLNSDNLEIPVCLGELETDIRFVEAHLHDLRVVLRHYENLQDPEDSDD
ncbi:MAG: hypothetical protein OXI24_15070 [Candidatus Poribacteria bacterium]|nr:hypothetical protein [Candidatus Poribacteria bacterium]